MGTPSNFPMTLRWRTECPLGGRLYGAARGGQRGDADCLRRGTIRGTVQGTAPVTNDAPVRMRGAGAGARGPGGRGGRRPAVCTTKIDQMHQRLTVHLVASPVRPDTVGDLPVREGVGPAAKKQQNKPINSTDDCLAFIFL